MSDFEDKASQHWSYVKEVIRDGRKDDDYVHLSIMDYLTIISYHYKTAMIHGYKHGIEAASLV